jgi:hypothetical protein
VERPTLYMLLLATTCYLFVERIIQTFQRSRIVATWLTRSTA